jgi:hypothetical protein
MLPDQPADQVRDRLPGLVRVRVADVGFQGAGGRDRRAHLEDERLDLRERGPERHGEPLDLRWGDLVGGQRDLLDGGVQEVLGDRADRVLVLRAECGERDSAGLVDERRQTPGASVQRVVHVPALLHHAGGAPIARDPRGGFSGERPQLLYFLSQGAGTAAPCGQRESLGR